MLGLVMAGWVMAQTPFCVTAQERASPPTTLPATEGLTLVGVVSGGRRPAVLVRQGNAPSARSVWLAPGDTLWARYQLVAVGPQSALLTNGATLHVLRLPRQPRGDWNRRVQQAPTCAARRRVPPQGT